MRENIASHLSAFRSLYTRSQILASTLETERIVSADLLKELEEMPPDPPRCRLMPFKEVILRWRRDGWTYRKIAATLHQRAGVQIAHQNVREFVLRHARPRK